MAKAANIGSPFVALVAASRLDTLEFGITAGLVALWLLPNWLYKLLRLAEAWRRRIRDEDTNKRS